MRELLGLAAAGAPRWIPDAAQRWEFLGMAVWKWVGLAIVIVAGVLLSLSLQRALLWVGRRLSALTPTHWDDQVVQAGRGPLAMLLFSALLFGGARMLQLPRVAMAAVDVAARSLLIFSMAWFVLRFLQSASATVEAKLAKNADPLRARSVLTQVSVTRAVVEITIYVVAAALLLVQFDLVRNVGVSILASAGLAGLVVGIAAQKSLGNLFAGIQLSLTQPIRIGDTVVVEGEFGTVEEIRLTYVVVNCWDLRRLVLPVSYFLEKPFANWSRESTALLGTVTLEADFTADVEAFRAELRRVLEDEGRSLWDGQSQGVVVTDALAEGIQLRALVSAKDAGALFDLRCLVREKLVALLVRHPEWLPQRRSRMQEGSARA